MKRLFIYIIGVAALVAGCTKEVPVSKDHQIVVEVPETVFDTLNVAYCNLDEASGDFIKEVTAAVKGTDICLFSAPVSPDVVDCQQVVSDAVSAWGHSVLAAVSDASSCFMVTAARSFGHEVVSYAGTSALVVDALGTRFLVGALKAEDSKDFVFKTLHADESAQWMYHLSGNPDMAVFNAAGIASCMSQGWNHVLAGSGVLDNVGAVETVPVEGMSYGIVKYSYQEEVAR